MPSEWLRGRSSWRRRNSSGRTKDELRLTPLGWSAFRGTGAGSAVAASCCHPLPVVKFRCERYPTVRLSQACSWRCRPPSIIPRVSGRLRVWQLKAFLLVQHTQASPKLFPDIVSIKDIYGMRPIHCALVCRAKIDDICLLVEAFPGDVKEVDNEGNLPLHLAIMQKKPPSSTLRRLLDYMKMPGERNLKRMRQRKQRHSESLGADQLSAKRSAQEAKLVSKDWADIVRLLLEADPDAVDKKNYHDRLPIALAIEYGAPEWLVVHLAMHDEATSWTYLVCQEQVARYVKAVLDKAGEEGAVALARVEDGVLAMRAAKSARVTIPTMRTSCITSFSLCDRFVFDG